jgi:hypothetical protein
MSKPLAKRPRRVYGSEMTTTARNTIKSFEDLLRVEWPAGTGRRGLATWAGIGLTGLANWAGCIPPGYHYRLHLWLTAHGYDLDPVTFGLRRDGYPIPPRSSGRAAAKAKEDRASTARL